MNASDPRILILRLSSIGDILLSTPLLQQVKKRFPASHVTYVVKKEFADLLEHNPQIDTLVRFDSSFGLAGLLDLAKDLKEDAYDMVFDLHNNLRTNRLTSVLNKNTVSKIKKDKLKRWLLVNLKINQFKNIKSTPEKYLDVCRKYDVIDNKEKLQIFWDDSCEKNIAKLLKNNSLNKKKYICLAPGAAHYTKMWPVENTQQLIEKTMDTLDTKIVLLGGPAEKDLLEGFNSEKRVVNFCGRTSLLESAGILNYSRGIVTNDSGLMHMATAVDVPLIALFGSTVEELGFFPFRANANVLQVDLWCRPCTHIGRKKCPLGHFNCMRLITVDDVFNEVTKRLI